MYPSLFLLLVCTDGERPCPRCYFESPLERSAGDARIAAAPPLHPLRCSTGGARAASQPHQRRMPRPPAYRGMHGDIEPGCSMKSMQAPGEDQYLQEMDEVAESGIGDADSPCACYGTVFFVLAPAGYTSTHQRDSRGD